MEVLYDRVAGLDIGKASVTVSVRTPGTRRGRHQETRTFKTTTGSLAVEGFGACTQIGECTAVCPKAIQLDVISQFDHDVLRALLRGDA